MSTKMRTLLSLIGQVILITCFATIGELISKSFDLALPGNIVGLLLLYLALKAKVVQVKHVERGGRLLLLIMPLFFVPALSGIMDYAVFLRQNGLQIVLIVIMSSLLTLVGSAYIVDRLAHRKDGVTPRD
ncbi:MULTISPECIES: CidA/LrgA family protein [unclassified Exiguobacterium]|uniref:CidA/LrgA family protein n=1 Tax=unclassified Exiguobacterium TaxID=2644629 RepID=UPI000B594ACD|nr:MULTISPECIES: CidA/LrgA family protein [unclassified Exiguobacterium]ASI34992.1 CidA/LrgA family protein [Exiguobacterium sp. N4-1P]